MIQRCTGAMRCQQLSQNLGSFFGVFFLFFPLFFWNSLKEMGKEGTGRADAVRRSFWRLWRSTESSPKGTCTFPGVFYCFTAKIRKAFPSEGFFKLETKKKIKENKHGMNQVNTTQIQTGSSEFLLFPTRSTRKIRDEKEVAQIHGCTFFFMFSIQICSANAKKRCWKTTGSLTAPAFIQGTLCCLVQRFRHKEEYFFLKKTVVK